MPRDIHPTVRRINLGYNSLTMVRDTDLTGLENVELLLLHSNSIHRVEDGAFSDLKALQVLKMSYNKVRELHKGIFQGLENLTRLYMDHNQIEFIHPEALYGLSSLELIQLDGNLLQQLHPDTFINLRHSQIFKFSSIKTIFLSENYLGSLPATLFTGCFQLENLYLNGNPWCCDCRMDWLARWIAKNPGVLKCKRDKKSPGEHLCPMCESPPVSRGSSIIHLSNQAYICSKPWIRSHLKHRNFTLDENSFSPVFPRDFIAPMGIMEMNLRDQFHNDAKISCVVQKPSSMDNLNVTHSEHALKVGITVATSLICNINYEHIRELWSILASYSDSPMTLQKSQSLTTPTEMIYKYNQVSLDDNEMFSEIEAEIKANPAWLMQNIINLQLDRTTTTHSTLHIKYQSRMEISIKNEVRNDRYSWTMIKRNNQTKTEFIVLLGGVAEINCHTYGDPKPSIEWILPDGSKMRAPYSSEDRRIVIFDDGRLTLKAVDHADAGIYHCIATNYHDADVLSFRVTVLPPDLEESEVNGVQISHLLGQSLFLHCETEGTAQATIQWILPDHTVMDQTVGNKNLYPNGTIGIHRLSERDRGIYRCLAANYLGEDLLASQVTLSSNSPKIITITDVEGSAEDVQPNRVSQESRTITSDRPYPRIRPLIRHGSVNRWGSRRRHGWSRRKFNTASNKVDPEIVADYLKRAQQHQTVKNESLKILNSETGSGDILSEGDGSISNLVTSTTENSENIYDTTIYPLPQNSFTLTTEYMRSLSTSYYPDAILVQPVTVSNYRLQKDDTTPLLTTQDQFENTHFESSTNTFLQPITLKYTITSTGVETEPEFSGDMSESVTEVLPPVTSQETNLTPKGNRFGQNSTSVVYTSSDPEGQTTYTAITTTRREQDKITLHTTQKFTSPYLTSGSTIISQQQIHIIPPDKKHPRRRRPFLNRRRIIRPNRITDIQNILEKLKKSSEKLEENATVPYVVRVPTERTSIIYSTEAENQKITSPTISPHVPTLKTIKTTIMPFTTLSIEPNMFKNEDKFKSNVSTTQVNSVDASEQEPTHEPTKYIPTTITSTTKVSKVIQGRIPWHRLFGNKDSQQEIIKRFKKPLTTTQTSTIITTTTTQPLSTLTTLPTVESLAAPMTARPPVTQTNNDDSEISSDDFSGLTSTESQNSNQVILLTTPFPSKKSDEKVPHFFRTTPKYGSQLSTSATMQSIYKVDLIKSADSNFRVSEKLSSRLKGSPRQRFERRRFRGRHPTKSSTTKAPTTTYPATQRALQTTSKTLWPTLRGETKSLTLTTPNVIGLNKAYTTTTNKPKIVTTPQTENQHNLIKKNPDTPFMLPLRTTLPTVVLNEHRYKPKNTSATNQNLSKERNGLKKKPPFDSITLIIAEDCQKGNSDITIKNQNTHDHTEVYETTASNILATELSTRDIALKPRIFKESTDSFTAQANSDAFLTCSAKGNPKPSISWKRITSSTGGTLSIKGKMGKFEILENGTLVIENVNIKDHGQYLCLAENIYGSDKHLVMLSVKTHPSRILQPKAREMKVHSGKTVEMQCQTVGTPLPVVSWILANRTQVRTQNQENGRVILTSEGTLVIRQVSIYDRGNYKCIASNSAGADMVSVRLQVVAAPPVILEEKRQLIRANVGQNIWMPCTAQGDPQPTTHWVLMGGTIVTSHHMDSRIFSFSNGTLHIKNLDVTDSGMYECIATSSTGSERRVVTLSVEKTEIPPQITETSDLMTAIEYGEQLNLNCSATGNPKPNIIWRLPSKALVDRRHRMGSRIQVLENGTLLIDAVSEKDAGDYLCVARSNAGDDLQMMKVSVSMKPAKIELKVTGKKQVPYGKDLQVDCKASGSPMPDISWGLPDGTMVNNAFQSEAIKKTRSKRYVLFENGTLLLNQVGMAEEGDYTCYAENTLGKDEMHVHITVVTAAPHLRPVNLTHAKIKPGGNVRFDCEAIGEPKPKILWMLPSSDIIAASNERYLMHVNGSLDIRNMHLADAGEYICIARNSAGEKNRVYNLEIDGNPPIINGYYQNRTVVNDIAEKFSRKLIDCRAEGDPPPKITWIMPDNIFLPAPYYGSRINVHPNGTLEIRNVRPTDTAEFICLARNDGGEAVMVVQLEVTNQLMRPIFKNPFNERMVTRLGKTAVLNCSAAGNPPPEMIWTLPNGTQFTGHHWGVQYHMGNDGTFVIHSPRTEDAGKYRCAAKNKIGYIEKMIILEVGQKPYILTRPRGIIHGTYGEPLFLHCLTDGSPRPNILWTTPGGQVLSQPQTTGRYRLMDNGTIVIHHTKLHDQGNYICRAKNTVGEAILKVPVMIIAHGPRITNGPSSSIQVIAGSPVQLNCISVGVPTPEITWERPDRSILSASNRGRELLNPHGTLFIQKPTRSDSGIYKCRAKNDIGTDTRVTYLRVI